MWGHSLCHSQGNAGPKISPELHSAFDHIVVWEKELYIMKTDYSGKMVVAFTIKEKTIEW